MTTHEEQQKIWDAEHAHPHVLLQMDSDKPSGGVEKFLAFMKENRFPHDRGIEMGCGKGRSVIWLARQGIEMNGFDFSPNAIAEAKRRAKQAPVKEAQFTVADATKRWSYDSDSFDFGIDCFASTDIVDPEGRKFAIQEMRRVLKPEGLFLAYLLSIDDEFHNEMIRKSPASERNTFLHPTGKFEKTYDEADIEETFKNFRILRKERIPKTAEFHGREYQCNHFWIVFQK